MDFTIERELFAKTLSQVCNIVNKRNVMPVLGHVLLRTIEDKLVIRATDMERDIVAEIPADVKTSGQTSIAAHLLNDIVKKLPEGTQINFALNQEKNDLVMKTQNSEFHFMTINAEEFPDFAQDPQNKKNFNFTLTTDSIKRIIEKTKFAILDDTTRYYLNGIYLHSSKNGKFNELHAVATDGHRLATCHVKMPLETDDIPGIIVPKKSVEEIARLVEHSDKPVNITVNENIIKLYFDKITLTSKLIDGNFPEYQKIVPKDNKIKAKVDVATFHQVVDRIRTISAEKTKAVRLSFDKNKLQVSASNNEDSSTITQTGASSAQEVMNIDYQDEPIAIGFNAQYLIDIANAVAIEDMIIEIKDQAAPILIKSSSADDMFFVLMPMRV